MLLLIQGLGWEVCWKHLGQYKELPTRERFLCALQPSALGDVLVEKQKRKKRLQELTIGEREWSSPLQSDCDH